MTKFRGTILVSSILIWSYIFYVIKIEIHSFLMGVWILAIFYDIGDYISNRIEIEDIDEDDGEN